MHIYPINGAAQHPGKSDTSWSYREVNFATVIASVDPDAANNECMIQWAKDYWLALHSHSSGGAYINMFMDEGDDRVKAKYGSNNFFRANQNIKPA